MKTTTLPQELEPGEDILEAFDAIASAAMKERSQACVSSLIPIVKWRTLDYVARRDVVFYESR